MGRYNVAVLGCGAIFSRHIQAIEANPDYYRLVGLYDVDTNKLNRCANDLKVKAYANEEQLLNDTEINCVAILTPSYLHYEQMLGAIQRHKHIIVEKPASFTLAELNQVNSLAGSNQVDVFTILQVRLNPALIAVKNFLGAHFGEIRGASLIQRWQRPLTYFSGWRGTMNGGGGVLREFSIHYLDAMLGLIGMPKRVTSANFYKTKFIDSDVHDTVYSHFDYGSFGASFEVSVAAEPSNLECSLTIYSDMGILKLGGKSLDVIVEAKFLDNNLNLLLQDYLDAAIVNNKVILANSGASPYHPELYRQIATTPEKFRLKQTLNVVDLIEQIYSFSV